MTHPLQKGQYLLTSVQALVPLFLEGKAVPWIPDYSGMTIVGCFASKVIQGVNLSAGPVSPISVDSGETGHTHFERAILANLSAGS